MLHFRPFPRRNDAEAARRKISVYTGAAAGESDDCRGCGASVVVNYLWRWIGRWRRWPMSTLFIVVVVVLLIFGGLTNILEALSDRRHHRH